MKRKVWLVRDYDGTYVICKYKPKKFDKIYMYALHPFTYVKNLCPDTTKKFFGLKKHLKIRTHVKVYFDIEIVEG